MSYSKTVTIGVWIETPQRRQQCPSYYAADYEVIQTYGGECPVRLCYESGYVVPMPKWLLVGIPGDRVAGELFSGFGGNNFASRALPLEPAKYNIQTYCYNLPKLVQSGQIVLKPEYMWLLEETPWKSPKAPKTWGEIPNE